MKVRAYQAILRGLTIAGLFVPLATQAAPITGGTTTVTFDPSTLSTLTGAGFSITPVNPATISMAPVAAMFPITGGDTTTNITHSGGLNLSRNATTAALTNFNINLTSNTLFGTVTAGGNSANNVALFDLSSASGATQLSLDPVLAAQIGSAFGVNLPSGTPIGTAAVAASVAPEPASVGFAALGVLGLLAKSALSRRRRRG